MKLHLRPYQHSCQQIAIEQATPHNEGGKAKKHAPHLGIGGSHGLHHSNKVGTLQNDDKQTAYHGEACHTYHEDKNDPHIGVEQFQPRKHAGIKVADGG